VSLRALSCYDLFDLAIAKAVTCDRLEKLRRNPFVGCTQQNTLLGGGSSGGQFPGFRTSDQFDT
jgi:hypothetical protein